MVTILCFKPCFKWLLPKIARPEFINTCGRCVVLNLVLNGYSLKFILIGFNHKKKEFRVLNLVLNGYSLKLELLELNKSSLVARSFKPCFKWLLPKIRIIRIK